MKLYYEQERALVKGIYLASGFSEYEADTVSRVITHSDFTGVYSHGLSRLTRFLRQIKLGVLNPNPSFKKVVDEGALLVFDGDNGSGIVSMNRAYDELLPKAKDSGIAYASGCRNANIGCGSYYGWRAVQDNMILLAGCNTYAFSAPFGGADKLLGTNPIIFAVPAGKEYPIVLDISTTCVASGKIQAAQREGVAIDPGWAKDINGNPTTNPAEAYTLNPIAGHKGYGLAIMIDLLSAALSKAAMGTQIGSFEKLEMENTGFFLMMIDPSKIMPIVEFKSIVDNYIRMMKDSRKAPCVEEVFLPGEIECRKFEENMKNGMKFSETLERELVELSTELRICNADTSFEQLVEDFSLQYGKDCFYCRK